jgi:hypothetical protein
VKDQFDIWRFDFPEKGEHSVIFLAREEIRLGCGVSVASVAMLQAS